MKLKRGSTSVRRLVFIADSSSATGVGLASLTSGSSGLVAYYFAGDLSDEVPISLTGATLGTFTSGGFVAVDNTNMPGWYEIGIPNTALDGGNEVAIQLRGATNMVPVNLYIELDSVDYQDTVRFGLTAIPNVAQGNAGQLPTADASGRVDLGKWIGTAPLALSSQQVQAVVPVTQKVDVETIKTNPVANGGTITFPTNATLASTTGNVGGIAAGGITSTSFATAAITAAAIAADAIGASELAADAVTEIAAAIVTNGPIAVSSGSVGVSSLGAGVITAASIATNAITAAKIAADAIGAAQLASDAIAEIQANLATAIALAVAQSDLDDIQTRLPAALVSGRMDSSVGAMAANTLTASALASDAVVEISTQVASDLATAHGVGSWITATGFATTNPDNTGIAAIKAVTDKYATMVVLDSSVYQFTANALELGPSGGGGGGSTTIIVAPLRATVPTNVITPSGTTQAFRYCSLPVGPIAAVDADGTPIDLTGYELVMNCVDANSPTVTFVLKSTDGQLTIGGVGNNQISVDYTPQVAGTFQRVTYGKPSGGDWYVLEIGTWEIVDGPDPAAL